MKHFYTLLFVLFGCVGYGQEVYFEKNESYTASKYNFIQKLTSNGDSLILESDKKRIKRVDILNENYLEVIDVKAKKAKINLQNLPLGSYVLQAKLGTHWIVMYLEKTDIIKTSDAELTLVEVENELELDKDLSLINADQVQLEEETMYWVVYESNSPFSSKKIMGLKYDTEIYDMISKIKLEVNTELGKNNKLLVYEIYDRKNFLRKQLNNHRYYKKKQSEFFNVSPIYTSEDDVK